MSSLVNEILRISPSLLRADVTLASSSTELHISNIDGIVILTSKADISLNIPIYDTFMKHCISGCSGIRAHVKLTDGKTVYELSKGYHAGNIPPDITLLFSQDDLSRPGIKPERIDRFTRLSRS
jgi:hypothetical protein